MDLRGFVHAWRLDEIKRGVCPLDDIDLQGWGSDHPIFEQLIAELRPRSIVELGTWKGASAVWMARLIRRYCPGATLMCVDTWLGGPGPHPDPPFIDDVLPVGARLRMLERFLSNILLLGLDDVVFPMPSTTRDAAARLARMEVQVDLVYVDAGHDEDSVLQDLTSYWHLVSPGGAIVGDDYLPSEWPGVVRSARKFARRVGQPLEVQDTKYVIRKPR